jgi:flavin-dependent dehydrogenase
MMNTHFDIVVLGTGPAGSAAARGLASLGYAVLCLAQVRSPETVEGISERVVKALQHQGFTRALRVLSEPIPRQVLWNGAASAANTEHLVDRQRFDAALIEDLQQHGVTVAQDWVSSATNEGDAWQVTTQSGKRFSGRFLIEARGRRANSDAPCLRRGPETVAMGMKWTIPPSEICTAGVMAFSHSTGWGWVVQDGRGMAFIQLSMAAERAAVKASRDAEEFIRGILSDLGAANPLPDSAHPAEAAHYRGSTALLHDAIGTPNKLRIGDAAMAVDPLSGNGIFQSLSSAMAAPAVINTLLQRPQDSTMALQFYQDRCEHLFERFSRMGRDFYQQIDADPVSDFFEQRRNWPDQQPSHVQPDRVLGTAERPVINDGFIERKTVVITADQPLGVWRVNGQDAVELLQAKQRD